MYAIAGQDSFIHSNKKAGRTVMHVPTCLSSEWLHSFQLILNPCDLLIPELPRSQPCDILTAMLISKTKETELL